MWCEISKTSDELCRNALLGQTGRRDKADYKLRSTVSETACLYFQFSEGIPPTYRELKWKQSLFCFLYVWAVTVQRTAPVPSKLCPLNKQCQKKKWQGSHIVLPIHPPTASIDIIPPSYIDLGETERSWLSTGLKLNAGYQKWQLCSGLRSSVPLCPNERAAIYSKLWRKRERMNENKKEAFERKSNRQVEWCASNLSSHAPAGDTSVITLSRQCSALFVSDPGS